MGLLDQITGLFRGGQGEQITKSIGGLFDDVGGIDGLMQKFDAAGLGDTVKSWVGTGENAAVSPEQVKEALGTEELEKVASEAGVSADQAANGLSKLLPDMVDKLTPDGVIPSTDQLKEQFGKLMG
jgi:uncharacterized protein YidB (DUF937 family)